ncbi:MAG: UbiX family flavin prenyltransferase [Aphanocapsa feldmannii 277cV]|uniref:Flavin prenyltransferase UbiX n=2 Tax=Aphanocapsa feldmannii TaxID=192050 RepID=A0A524RKT2_9CHRO|nr:MAG: UbiX family flavin prenyltransferase [Aphanocapsa feldmannii 288cV]TGG90463.1 MAG: UbiX family flavin prenyltransferase [Aphanocapsa feldmannii 277cV]TGH27860.1 MAG: UbiX family flavin prenyltransferase [Aphanocapsa feldmannii 277cI]
MLADADLPLVLGVTGASAQQLAVRALQLLLDAGASVDLVASRGAALVWQTELGLALPTEPARQEAFWRERTGSSGGCLRCHRWSDQAARVASGSFRTRGMLILPCTMGSVGRIAAGVALDLVERCADVHLKEGRALLIAPREMPWSLVHLRNLTTLAEAGARIVPPIPAWYQRPESIDDMVDFLVVRMLDGLGYDLGGIHRWQGPITALPEGER